MTDDEMFDLIYKIEFGYCEKCNPFGRGFDEDLCDSCKEMKALDRARDIIRDAIGVEND